MSFLPGFHPGMFAALGLAPIIACDLIDSSYTTSTDTFTLPSSIEKGDLVVLVSTDSAGSAVAEFTISGVTATQLMTDPRNNGAGLHSRMQIDAFLSDGTEAGDSISYSAVLTRLYILVFRANRPLRSFTPGGSDSVFATGNPAAISIPATGSTAEPTLSVAWYYCQNANVDPRDMTPTKDGELTDGAPFPVAWVFQLVSGASDVAVDMADEGLDNGLGGVWIGLA